MSKYQIVPTSETDWHPTIASAKPYAVTGTYEHTWRGYQPFRSREEAEAYIRELEFYDSQPVGVRKSGPLEHARTVLSRARTAIEYMSGDQDPDEEKQAILVDLAIVVLVLERWQRTGRMPKYKG